MSFYDIDEASRLSRVEQLVTKDPDGAKQFEQVSEYSPCAVDSSELLARSLDYPNKFTGDGGLSDSLFQDAFKFGASAQRLVPDWSTHESSVHARFEARAMARREGADGRAGDPENLYVGAFHISAEELRACRLNDDTDPRVRVYDAGKYTDQLHAEIVVDATNLTKVQRKELRVRLMSLAEKRGLHVSPHLSTEDRVRAEGTQCLLHWPTA